MYEIIFKKRFKIAYKKIKLSGNFERDNFMEIFSCLEKGLELPQKYYDHALTANLFGQRECHISGDMLLVYEIDKENKTVTLANIGNHAQVFGS